MSTCRRGALENGHGGEALSSKSGCRHPGRSCECPEAEHRNARDQPHLQLPATTGSRSAELLSASQGTEHCGRRQVLQAPRLPLFISVAPPIGHEWSGKESEKRQTEAVKGCKMRMRGRVCEKRLGTERRRVTWLLL